MLARQRNLLEQYVRLGGFKLDDYPVLATYSESIEAYGWKPPEFDEELEALSDESLTVSLALSAMQRGISLRARQDESFRSSELFERYQALTELFEDDDEAHAVDDDDITSESLRATIARDHKRRSEVADLLGIDLEDYPLLKDDLKAFEAVRNPAPARIRSLDS